MERIDSVWKQILSASMDLYALKQKGFSYTTKDGCIADGTESKLFIELSSLVAEADMADAIREAAHVRAAGF